MYELQSVSMEILFVLFFNIKSTVSGIFQSFQWNMYMLFIIWISFCFASLYFFDLNYFIEFSASERFSRNVEMQNSWSLSNRQAILINITDRTAATTTTIFWNEKIIMWSSSCWNSTGKMCFSFSWQNLWR